MKANSKPVLYATDLDAVRSIEVAPLVPRVVGRVGMQIGVKCQDKL